MNRPVTASINVSPVESSINVSPVASSINVPKKPSFLIPIVAGAVVVLGIIAFLVYYFYFRSGSPEPEPELEPPVAPVTPPVPPVTPPVAPVTPPVPPVTPPVPPVTPPVPPSSVPGCMDSGALNYSAFATEDNSTCKYALINTTNDFQHKPRDGESWSSYNNESCGYLRKEIQCSQEPCEMDKLKRNNEDIAYKTFNNYGLKKTTGPEYKKRIFFYKDNENKYWTEYDLDIECPTPVSEPVPPPSVPGCMDSGALNYNAFATEDNSTCKYALINTTNEIEHKPRDGESWGTYNNESCGYLRKQINCSKEPCEMDIHTSHNKNLAENIFSDYGLKNPFITKASEYENMIKIYENYGVSSSTGSYVKYWAEYKFKNECSIPPPPPTPVVSAPGLLYSGEPYTSNTKSPNNIFELDIGKNWVRYGQPKLWSYPIGNFLAPACFENNGTVWAIEWENNDQYDESEPNVIRKYSEDNRTTWQFGVFNGDNILVKNITKDSAKINVPITGSENIELKVENGNLIIYDNNDYNNPLWRSGVNKSPLVGKYTGQQCYNIPIRGTEESAVNKLLPLSGVCDGFISDFEVYPADVTQWRLDRIAGGEKFSGSLANVDVWKNTNADMFLPNGKKFYVRPDAIGHGKIRESCDELKSGPIVMDHGITSNGQYGLFIWKNPNITLPPRDENGNGLIFVKK